MLNLHDETSKSYPKVSLTHKFELDRASRPDADPRNPFKAGPRDPFNGDPSVLRKDLVGPQTILDVCVLASAHENDSNTADDREIHTSKVVHPVDAITAGELEVNIVSCQFQKQTHEIVRRKMDGQHSEVEIDRVR